MTEKKPASQGAGDSGRDEEVAAEETERRLGRFVSIGLPIATVVSAIGVGAFASVGSGLLVAAAGTLLGTIAFLWASLRTLSGDAPLPYGLEEGALRDEVDALAEQKRRALRALKDLEAERALGRIDDADYELVQASYRAEAKEVMRRMDERAAPSRADAERIARAYLKQHMPEALNSPKENRKAAERDDDEEALGDAALPAPNVPLKAASKPTERIDRIACPKCGGSNEGDAVFCKHCGAAVEPKTDYSDASA